MTVLAVLVDPFLLPGTQSHGLLDVVALLCVLFLVDEVVETNELV